MSTLTFASLALVLSIRGQHGQYAYAGASVHQQSATEILMCNTAAKLRELFIHF